MSERILDRVEDMPAVQSGAIPLKPDPHESLPDLHGGPHVEVSKPLTTPCSEEADDVPLVFPTQSLPPKLREFVEAIAKAHRVPEALPACCALAATAAAIGPGLELLSGPDQQRTRANIFILASADSGSGKSKVFKQIITPLFEFEAEQMEQWRKHDGPHRDAEEIFLNKQIEELKKDIKKHVSDDDRERLIAALAHPKARLEELKSVTAPRLVCQDATIEALGVRLAQSQEALFSACADARKLADNLLGRNNPGRMVDDSIYLQAFSGDSIVVDRQSRDTLILREPCLTLLWLVQPDIVEKLLAEAALQAGGFLARLLLCHTNAVPVEWTTDAITVSDSVRQQWAALLTALLRPYRMSGAHHIITVPQSVWERFRDYHNPIVRRLNDDLTDVKAYAMRWTEQAMRLSLVHHAGLWGKDAHEHVLSLESAESGIAMGDWFSAHQLQVLDCGRQEARKKLEARLLALFDEYWQRFKQDYLTVRIAQNRHIARTAPETEAVFDRMLAEGVLVVEEVRRPEGGHVERRYRLRCGRNPVPA
jgi:hypothetical protein